VETEATQILGNAASNDAESDYANVLSRSTRHSCGLFAVFSLR
jgi:hypothetical protein